MKHSSRSRYVRSISRSHWVSRWYSWTPVTVLFLSSLVVAAPPAETTFPPFYSFDAISPTVADGTVGSADILLPGPDDTIIILLRGADFGMPLPGDDVDACSGPSSNIASGDSFTLLISVDEFSVGAVPPDQNLVQQGVPYNAADQAEKGQAAGDQFMGLDLFTRAGGPLPGSNGRAGDNNTLLRNNYNEGGSGFGGQPATGASSGGRSRGVPVLQDNVDCMFGTRVPIDPPGPANLLPLYFSASADSPSLQDLPGLMPSGASVFYHGLVQGGPLPETRLYASFADLGLLQGDDITGMIVFDAAGDNIFDPQDQVVFSLAPGSPSLSMIGGPGKVASSADVFTVDASGNPAIFVTAAGLGLDPSLDNIDALDFLTCTDAIDCALRHAIRAEALIPAVSTWGMIVMTILMMVGGTLVWARRQNSAA